MPQRTSPFVEGKYGWDFGEDSWNLGMDQNILKFSYLFDRNVDSITDNLPPPINGQAHYLTTDNRLYFVVEGAYLSSPTPKWFIVALKSTGQLYQFNGESLVEVKNASEIEADLGAIELALSSLGSAAYQDESYFAKVTELDVAEANAANYTDALRQELGEAAGAGLIGYDADQEYQEGTLGATLRNMSITINPKMFGYIGDGSPADAASFKSAAEYASANSLPFSAQGLHIVVKSALSIAPTGAVDWSLNETVFEFQLPSDVPVGLQVSLQPGHKHRVSGSASFNFAGKAHTGVMFIQPTANVDGTEFHASGLSVSDIEMQVGAGVASAGLCVRGGFQLVRLRDCSATNIKMRPGAGVIGSSGITGLLVVNHFGVAGAYARRTEIEGGDITDVYSLDPSFQYDMDGIGIFANPVDTSNGLSSCDIRGVRFKNCWGRALKSQTGRSHAEGLRLNMDTQPTDGCVNPLVDFQTGSASASDIRAFLSGVNVMTLVAFQGTADSGSIVSTLDFVDASVDASATLREVVFATPLSTNIPMATECRNILVRGAVQNVGRIGTSTFDTQSLHIENCIAGQVTQSLIHALSVGGGAAPYRALVSAKNCRNMTGSVPLVWSNDAGQTTRTLVGVEGTIRGFLRASGLFNDSAVGAIGGLGVSAGPDLPEDVRGTGLATSGSRRLLGIELAAGETFTLPEHGWNCYFAIVTMGALRTTACQVVVDADGATAVYAGANTGVGLTTEPETGLLKVWASSGQLVIKNATTSNRIITVELLG